MLEYFNTTASRLSIGGIDFEKILNEFHSPLYVYDADIIRKKFETLRSAMPAHVDIFYAVKSNPNLAVLKFISELGAGFDVASIGELAALQKLQIPGSKIVFTGPGKSDEEIEHAIGYGIYSFNCESENEIHRLDSAAGKVDGKIRIGMRINTEYAIQETTPIIGGSQAKKFGIDEHKVLGVLERIKSLRHIYVAGIHVFNATQVLDYREIAANTKNILELAAHISEKAGLRLEYIDVGGGLGIPYAADEKELDIQALGEEFLNCHHEFSKQKRLPDIRWILEPGRYVSGECGVFLTKVVDVKESRGIHFVITDAGINQFLRPALIGQNHPVCVANKLNVPPVKIYRIEGPLCTSLDCLARDVHLPEVEPGDTIGFFNAGAYGFTESMPFFLSHPVPAEVMVKDKKAFLIRKRMEPDDYINNCIIEGG